MMRWLRLIVTIPVMILVVLFALSNRGMVTLHLFPLPFEMTSPVYLLVLLVFILGFVIGGLSVWNADRKYRRAARAEHRRAEEAERELEKARSEAARPIPVAQARPLAHVEPPRVIAVGDQRRA